MRRALLSPLLVLVFVVACLVGCHSSAIQNEKPEVAKPASPDVLASVPATFRHNTVLIPVSINGSAPLHLVVNTGFPPRGILLTSSAPLQSLNVEFRTARRPPEKGPGPDVTVGLAPLVDIGGFKLLDVPLVVYPQNDRIPPDVDGIIGNELLERCAARIDVDGKRVDLLESGKYGFSSESGTVLPLRFREEMPFVDASVATVEGPAQPAELFLELGQTHGVWLNDRGDGRFAVPPGAISRPYGNEDAGRRVRVGRAQNVGLGDIKFDNLVAVYADSSGDDRDGFIGADILTRFNLVIDYGAKKMALERCARFAEPFEYDMTGLVLAPGLAGGRKVLEVVPGSPAAEVEVHPGDLLVAVDGKGLEQFGADGVSKTFRQPDKEVRITLERDGRRVEKTIRMRRLV